jgi:superfamily I DNA and/or RNA helicase
MNRIKVLSVKRKVKVIWQVENGKKKAEECREFDLINSASRTVWKNRTKIINAFKQNGSRIKLFSKPKRSDVDETLLRWFKQQRSYIVPMGGPLLW